MVENVKNTVSSITFLCEKELSSWDSLLPSIIKRMRMNNSGDDAKEKGLKLLLGDRAPIMPYYMEPAVVPLVRCDIGFANLVALNLSTKPKRYDHIYQNLGEDEIKKINLERLVENSKTHSHIIMVAKEKDNLIDSMYESLVNKKGVSVDVSPTFLHLWDGVKKRRVLG